MAVEWTISTSGYLEYWSVMTSVYSLLGNGVHKSISMVSQGLSGSFVILAGFVCCLFVAICQSKQVLTTVSMR